MKRQDRRFFAVLAAVGLAAALSAARSAPAAEVAAAAAASVAPPVVGLERRATLPQAGQTMTTPGAQATLVEPVSRRLRFDTAAELERELAAMDYQWPPRNGVPVVVVDAFPGDLADLPVVRKKALFFRSLLPLVLAENRQLREQREFLLDALPRLARLNEHERTRLNALAVRYRVDTDLAEPRAQASLLSRADEIPPALVLAQAANESGWGTSRFAREGNNLFGMWTYDSSRGLLPGARNKGARHRVRAYEHLRESVAHYMLTLNRLPAYRDLRRMRERQRASGAGLNAAALAEGLLRYSERGQDYVAEIQQMIRSNRLHAIDRSRLHG